MSYSYIEIRSRAASAQNPSQVPIDGGADYGTAANPYVEGDGKIARKTFGVNEGPVGEEIVTFNTSTGQVVPVGGRGYFADRTFSNLSNDDKAEARTNLRVASRQEMNNEIELQLSELESAYNLQNLKAGAYRNVGNAAGDLVERSGRTGGISATAVSGLDLPTRSDHATSKAYVDALAQGLSWQHPVAGIIYREDEPMPPNPSIGDRYIVRLFDTPEEPNNAIWEWAEVDESEQWVIFEPQDGWTLWNLETDELLRYHNGSWGDIGQAIYQDISSVQGLQQALDNKSDVGHTHAWGAITGKPTTFPPASHGHSFSEITGVAEPGQIPGLPASRITSGIMSTNRLPVATDIDPGIVSTANQTFAGHKRFKDGIQIGVETYIEQYDNRTSFRNYAGGGISFDVHHDGALYDFTALGLNLYGKQLQNAVLRAGNF